MPLIKVREKYQVTLPSSVRQKVGVAVGDLLEAKVQGKKITLTPKRLIDREIALALEDFKRGRSIGPFRTAKAAIRALRRAAR
ncbi:MAG TPA: AbrB/MazE/SpoVT family DNA-binding domain-containing protein [Candidatus Methylomirabilis sp.]|nr:AbrB/MazE/SpoVT family DNA-binding domain-containing protein [Candidatus Methylomirabilis sp.]